VAYEADASNTETSSTGAPTDCSRSAHPGGAAARAVVEARFYLSGGKLMCAGNFSATPYSQSDTLAENIEELHLEFGIAASTTDGRPFGHLTTTAAIGSTDGTTVGNAHLATVTGETAKDLAGANIVPNLGAGAARWRLVRTVRLCVVVKADRTAGTRNLFSSAGTDKPTYVGCDGEAKTIDDGYLRRAYSTTVVLRNRYPETAYN
jgi:type IV pilus assembly protein PilW